MNIPGPTSKYPTFNGLFTAIDAITFAPAYTVVINEFFFRANEEVPDYVELFNYGSEDVDLTGWDLLVDEEGELGSFDGYVLGAGEYLLLASDDPFFNADGDEFVAGEDIDNSLFFDISLGTSNDPIQLLDSDGNEVDLVIYNDDDGWLVGNTYRGSAVELSDPYSDNNDPSNWDSSNAEGTYMYTEDGDAGEDFGTPGEPNSNYTTPILGCTDSTACNYDSDATVDDGSCSGYPDNGNYSLSFDGENDNVSLGDVNLLDVGQSDFSIKVKFKVDQNSLESGRVHTLVSKRDVSYGNGYELIVGNSGMIQATLYDNSSETLFYATSDGGDGNEVANGNWHTVYTVFDRDGSGIIYLNGVAGPNVELGQQGDLNSNHCKT